LCYYSKKLGETHFIINFNPHNNRIRDTDILQMYTSVEFIYLFTHYYSLKIRLIFNTIY